MGLKFQIILLTLILFLGQIIIVFGEDGTKSDKIDNNWQPEFVKSVILVLIPVVAAVFTSARVVNSWQIRNEKSRIKRDVLSELENSVKHAALLMDVFVGFLSRQYSDYLGVKAEIESPRVDLILKFPSNEQEQPFQKFAKEYDIFEKEIAQTRFGQGRLLSSLRLYYRNDELEQELEKLNEKLGSALINVEQLIRAQNGKDFIAFSSAFNTKYNDIIRMVKAFELKLVDAKLYEIKI